MNPCPRCESTDIYESRGFGPGIAMHAFIECRKCELLVVSRKGEIHLARDKWNSLLFEHLVVGVSLYKSD